MGYLVCEKCGGYYELQEGESPDDFDNCQCGGRLRYFDNLDEYRSYDHDLTEYSHINEPGVDKLNPDDETLSSEEVYDETIYLTWLIGIFILTFVGVFIVQSLIVPIDAKPTFNLVFIIVILAALFTANFLILRIKITQEYISMSFGLFKNIISWQDINNCIVNEPSTVKFRGYGINTFYEN